MRIAIGFYVDSKHKWSGSSKELAIKNVVSEKTGKQYFRLSPGPISNTKRLVYVFLYTVLTQFDRTVSLAITHVDTPFLFVLQGSEVLKEHHCVFVYSTKASQCAVLE